MSEALDRPTRARLNRALVAGWVVMLWERAAAVWAPLLLAAGAIAVAGLWGLFTPLSPMSRDLIVAAVVVIALGFAIRGLIKLRAPKRAEMIDRIETDSNLPHRSITMLADKPVTGDSALWALHQAQSQRAAAKARVGRPRAGLAAADPFALRYALVVAAILALFARGFDREHDVVTAFTPVTQVTTATGHVLANAGDGVTHFVSDLMRDAGKRQSSAAIPGRPRNFPAASRP
jgi:hypothetical protein